MHICQGMALMHFQEADHTTNVTSVSTPYVTYPKFHNDVQSYLSRLDPWAFKRASQPGHFCVLTWRWLMCINFVGSACFPALQKWGYLYLNVGKQKLLPCKTNFNREVPWGWASLLRVCRQSDNKDLMDSLLGSLRIHRNKCYRVFRLLESKF